MKITEVVLSFLVSLGFGKNPSRESRGSRGQTPARVMLCFGTRKDGVRHLSLSPSWLTDFVQFPFVTVLSELMLAPLI